MSETKPKNSGRAPSMQWYPADWRQDNSVQALSFHDRGVWFELLNIMHSTSERGVLVINGKAMTTETIARLVGLDKQNLETCLTTLIEVGCAKVRESDGAIYSKRMVEDERLSDLRRTAGKMGGNPRLVNQNPTTPVNQKPTPSSSSSFSSSVLLEKEPKLSANAASDEVEAIYQAYPRKVGKPAAIREIRAALRGTPAETLLQATQAYAVARQGQDENFTPHPATWFRQKRFLDEPSTWSPQPSRNGAPDFSKPLSLPSGRTLGTFTMDDDDNNQ